MFNRSRMFGFGCAVAALISTSAARAQDFDVLGIALDSPVADIAKNLKLAGAHILPEDGTLGMGDYTSPTLHFGATISDDDNPRYMYSSMTQPDKDYLSLAFDFRAPQKVIYIERIRQYSPATSPTLADVMQSFAAKYGKPVSVETAPSSGTIMIWNKDSEVRYSRLALSTMQCYLPLADLWSTSIGKFGVPPDPILAKCGTWMWAQAAPDSANPALVRQIILRVGDLTAVKASYDAMMDSLSAGAAQAAKAEQDKASQNKPQL